MIYSYAALALGNLLLLAPQQVVRSFPNVWLVPLRAAPMVVVEDYDGDGFREVLIGEAGTRFGELRILAGESAQLIQSIAFDEFKLGYQVAFLGDVTGDGFGDFLGSGYLGNRGHLWNGATRSRIWNGPSFDSASGIGDIDGDGVGDFLLGIYGIPGEPGSARVYYGGRYQEAYSLAPPGTISYGQDVAALGDVDRDGIGDFAVGAPGLILGETCSAGEVYVHSGADGRVLYRLEGEGVNSGFGENLAPLGDITGDGIGDLAVSALLCCAVECERGGAGRVSFFDGATGRLLEHVLGSSYGVQRFGQFLQEVGDLDGNGYGDVLVHASAPNGPTSGLGILIAIDGATRQSIYTYWTEGRARCAFLQMAAVGDMAGDGFPDYYLSAACGQIGVPDDRIDVVSGAPIGVRTLENPCPLELDRSLRIGATGVPRIGRHVPIHLTGVAPGVEARLVIGDRPPPASRSKVRGCPSVFPLEVQRVLAKPVRPGQGVATGILSIPNQVDLIGTKCYAQWVIREGSRTRTSRILEIEVQASSPYRGQ